MTPRQAFRIGSIAASFGASILDMLATAKRLGNRYSKDVAVAYLSGAKLL